MKNKNENYRNTETCKKKQLQKKSSRERLHDSNMPWHAGGPRRGKSSQKRFPERIPERVPRKVPRKAHVWKDSYYLQIFYTID